MSEFGINGLLAFFGLAFLAFGVFKKERQEKTIFLVWTLMILWALFQQNRFAYYFAVNIAILSAYFGVTIAENILEFGGWKNIMGRKDEMSKSSAVKKSKKSFQGLSKDKPVKDEFSLKNIKVSNIISLCLAAGFVFLLVYPLYDRLTENPDSSLVKLSPSTTAWEMGKYYRGMKVYMYESLTWMRYNTPDPGIDYYGKYQEPPPGVNYSYPDSAYGVMSWWDYGHVITAWAHRIPNANPFQAGIGGGPSHLPGASTFLSAQSEEEANAVLDALGTNGKPGARYVLTDDYINFAAFGAVLAWADIPYEGYYIQKGNQVVPYTKRYNAMMMRLHLFDGDGLKTYRLVHESVPAPNADGAVGYGEAGYKEIYNKLYGGNLPVAYTGAVKIFEYVKGAHITGKSPTNETVSISLKVKTNQGREYSYSQKTVSNGAYELIVPYSTEGPISGQTQFDTKPTGAYTVTSGNISKQVEISEKDVLEGGTVTLDLV
jgi:dolichyl-diphosphooligosaccharide--protein glycosyltransferase